MIQPNDLIKFSEEISFAAGNVAEKITVANSKRPPAPHAKDRSVSTVIAVLKDADAQQSRARHHQQEQGPSPLEVSPLNGSHRFTGFDSKQAPSRNTKPGEPRCMFRRVGRTA